MTPLSDDEITARLATLPGWERRGKAITKTYVLTDFPAAVAFVVHIGILAETVWHHPNLTINWNKVGVTLTTHDAGGITDKDFNLAAKFEATQ